SYSFIFSIYDVPVGGVGIWTEAQTVEVKDGLIHAYLGSVSQFDPAIFNNSTLWLGIKFGSEPEFSPRHMIGSTVYSFLSANSLLLGGYGAAHFADSDLVSFSIAKHNSDSSAHHPLSVDAAEITSGTIAPERLPAVSVDSTNIVDGGVSAADLADSVISGSKLQTGVIDSEHMADAAVNSVKVADGSLLGSDLQDSTITGEKIAAGSIEAAHLSVAAFGGDKIIDGSLTNADYADFSVTGTKIAAGAITSTHLSAIAITGAQITDGTVTGMDITNGTIGYNDIGPNSIAGYHIQDGSINGAKIQAGSITGAEISDESLAGADLANNTIIERHVTNNSISSAKLVDEPGLAETSGGTLTSIGTTVVNWMNVTINAPAPGYVLVFMHGIASLGGNEIAQMAISTTSTGFAHYGEAKISSPNASVGGNITVSISDVIPVAAAGPVTIYGNVRSIPLSAGVVDVFSGKLQAIYIRTGY
ncbi:MAG: hypothetical protein WBP29_14220, partial [Candidatus Zixiibacteriota bacterium]